MNVETPLGNRKPHRNKSSTAKNVAIFPKMCSAELGKKSIKKEIKNQFLNIIFHPFAPSTLLGQFVPFLARRVKLPT